MIVSTFNTRVSIENGEHINGNLHLCDAPSSGGMVMLMVDFVA